MNPRPIVLFFIISCFLLVSELSVSAPREAQYANLSYDVVYVRCPRGREPINVLGRGEQLNWNGINDIWLSATNNIYQQPGCDLVLHHSDPNYQGGLPLGDRAREEVLVDCDETDSNSPICTIADPNVSFDGRYIVYAKFSDTRNFVTNMGALDLDWSGYLQTYMRLDPNGSNGQYAKAVTHARIQPYDAPVYIFKYDLLNKTEQKISPESGFFAGLAYPQKDTEWVGNIPVIDNGPFFTADGRIGFTSNRAHGFNRFQLFTMDVDGKNLQLIGHRAMSNQLHPAGLKDGRIAYTNKDNVVHKVENNNFSLFTVNPDGSDPFILAGKQDATLMTYHYLTQLSDGDIVVTLYYNHNNTGLGSFLRFPIDPPGADFIHLKGSFNTATPIQTLPPANYGDGLNKVPFARKGQFRLTPDMSNNDVAVGKYDNADDYWIHPSRVNGGSKLSIGGQNYTVDDNLVAMKGRVSHPAAAPDNDLLATYTIGSSSQMEKSEYSQSLAATLEVIGKDAGVWLFPLEANSTRQIGHIADDARIVVDFPEYHEIMPRPIVSYNQIYGIPHPGMQANGELSENVVPRKNDGTTDSRLPAGAPYALSGAATLYDRETRALNGTPWNATMGNYTGRKYTNLVTSGAELAIFDNDEIYGIRVLMPIMNLPNDVRSSEQDEHFMGRQSFKLRIMGEFPVRKPGNPLDDQGNPDTSFIARLPADTPFLFQTIDKNGMALDFETTSRSAGRGEVQLCGGCHVHTRESLDPSVSRAKLNEASGYGDFVGKSAPLFDSFDSNTDLPIVKAANDIYDESTAPGVTSHRTFAVDWKNGVSTIIQNRCSSCHAEGTSAQQLTGLRLDGDDRTYNLLVDNEYIREDGTTINSDSKPGDGLNDVINQTQGTDRIISRTQRCCTVSRWLSLNSARSSMLVWALYGERMDGRDPATGLPPAGSGVVVDGQGLEKPEVWPKVNEHLAYVSNMPEFEKRLIARWIDIGTPYQNVHDDKTRPVLTLTPVLSNNSVSTILVGLWDDSSLDFSRFKVTENGNEITPTVTNEPVVVTVTLTSPITTENAANREYTFEIWDSPNRNLSMVDPGVSAANRTRKTVTGTELLRMASVINNYGDIYEDVPGWSLPIDTGDGNDTGGGNDTGSGNDTGGNVGDGNEETGSGTTVTVSGGAFGTIETMFVLAYLLILAIATAKRRKAS